MRKWITIGARLLLGSIFIVTGVNGFAHFIPAPQMADPGADYFFSALFTTPSFLYFEKTVEVISGLMLLSNRYVPLGLAILAPIIANVLVFHIFLAKAGLLPIAAGLTALEGYLVYAYWPYFRSVVTMNATPAMPRQPSNAVPA
jgi:uncharacterized membrane protein YphA (DoxX/SURF4 family)